MLTGYGNVPEIFVVTPGMKATAVRTTTTGTLARHRGQRVTLKAKSRPHGYD